MKEFLQSKGLTFSEIAVVTWLMLTGKTNKEIAFLMEVKEKTIKFHFTNVYKKLGVKNRSGLILLLMAFYTPPTPPTVPLTTEIPF